MSKKHKIDIDIKKEHLDFLKEVAKLSGESLPAVIRVILAIELKKHPLKDI